MTYCVQTYSAQQGSGTSITEYACHWFEIIAQRKAFRPAASIRILVQPGCGYYDGG